jgi:hypothetical protein
MDEKIVKNNEDREGLGEATAYRDEDRPEVWTRETSGPAENEGQPVPLIGIVDMDELQSRWNAIQIEFVDEPRETVEAADALVEEVMNRISRMFAETRAGMDAQWIQDKEVSTEDLRMALQSYRSFFKRLLSV